MKIKNQLSIERLVAKVDNDFNISESDWIPRVAAWTIDALSQMKILPSVKKKRQLEVSDKIAQFPCDINNAKEIRVYDKYGCEIPELDYSSCHCNSDSDSDKYATESEIAVIDSTNKTGVNYMEVASIVNGNSNHNYVLDGNNIELNFDTDYIIVVSYEVATYYDEYYDCEVPYIYDNGLLLEALSWYILFKYLSRGSKHQVYDLKSNSPVTNPWIQWNTLRPKAAASVRNELNKDVQSDWNNFFYNFTFNPRGI